ncbi:ornithine decarboxylase-like [Anopheles marshallii]|uniref:ornithine decarboxylase-like n=1 Tax=Anopheles marshallii TaxID=1521116 RepID=UPI00237AEAF6|nr:ornithine decarboxylase-like [Anopheles marshallii]
MDTPQDIYLSELKNVTIRPATAGSLEEEINRIIAGGTREHPLHLLDLDDLVRKHLTWLRSMPRVTPFYAVKCNDDPAILASLAALGTGFDCASEAEMRTILALGVTPDRIIFAHPIKSVQALAFAKTHGIRRMTFDNEHELAKVAREYPEAELVLRIRHDSDRVLIALGKKFGCDARGDGRRLLARAQALGVTVIGVSFHVGCGSLDADCFYHAIESARSVFDYAQDELGMHLWLLDVGGGFPGDNDKPIDEYASAVSRGLQKFFPEHGDKVYILGEPGRFYVGSAVTLLTTVQGKKVVRDAVDNVQQMMYYINDGVFGTLFDWLSLREIKDLKRAVPLVRRERLHERIFPTTIWGPTCDSTDIVCEEVEYPEHHIGDYIVFENLGAYGMTFATNFNGFPKPTVQVYVKEDTWAMLHSIAGTDWRRKTLTLLESILAKSSLTSPTKQL